VAMKKAATKKKSTKKVINKKSTKKGANEWSAAGVAFLKANYRTKTAREIAKRLSRSIDAVRAKAATLNLKKGPVKKKAAAKKSTAKKSTAKKSTAKKGTKKAGKK
jgi:DNA-binding protein HU-beta